MTVDEHMRPVAFWLFVGFLAFIAILINATNQQQKDFEICGGKEPVAKKETNMRTVYECPVSQTVEVVKEEK